MKAIGYKAKAIVSHPLTTLTCAGCLPVPSGLPVHENAWPETARDPASNHNETLIFTFASAISGRDRRHGAMAAAIEGIAMPVDLNAFFANSVNSPAMSMVNFFCCVGDAPESSVGGLIRKMAPQPRRVAVRMEAGAHACL